MSRHNAQLRAAASAYENAEPEGELDGDVWQAACEAVAKTQAAADAEAVWLLADTGTESALYAVIHKKPLTFADAAAIHSLYEAAKSTQEAVQSRYDELIANGGRP